MRGVTVATSCSMPALSNCLKLLLMSPNSDRHDLTLSRSAGAENTCNKIKFHSGKIRYDIHPKLKNNANNTDGGGLQRFEARVCRINKIHEHDHQIV